MSDLDSPEKIAALREFHGAFGKALAAWAGVEDGLFEWFKTCTGVPERMARAIYYSSRSFAGRRDMLVAAMPMSSLDEKTKEGVRQCVKRARTYSEFRNRITHGHIIFNAALTGRAASQYVFAQGKSLSGPFEDDEVTIDEIRIAAENFEELAHLILGFHPEWQHHTVCEAGCLEEILALPREANSRERPPKPS